MDIMELKKFLLLLSAIIASLILCAPGALWGCAHNFDRGEIFPAIENTLSLPGDNPVKEDLINRGLVIYGNLTPGTIKVGEIEQLVNEGIYIIDKDGYLQFGPSYTPTLP
jgi:hypothetical protein